MAGWSPLPPQGNGACWEFVIGLCYWQVGVGHSTVLIATSALVRGHAERLSLQPWPLRTWAPEQASEWGWLTFLGKSSCSHDYWEPSSQLMFSVGHLYGTQMYSYSVAIPRGPTTYDFSQTFLSPVLQFFSFQVPEHQTV